MASCPTISRWRSWTSTCNRLRTSALSAPDQLVLRVGEGRVECLPFRQQLGGKTIGQAELVADQHVALARREWLRGARAGEAARHERFAGRPPGHRQDLVQVAGFFGEAE